MAALTMAGLARRIAALETTLAALPMANPYSGATDAELLDLAEKLKDALPIAAHILEAWCRVDGNWQRVPQQAPVFAPQAHLTSEVVSAQPETEKTPPRAPQRVPGIIRVI